MNQIQENIYLNGITYKAILEINLKNTIKMDKLCFYCGAFFEWNFCVIFVYLQSQSNIYYKRIYNLWIQLYICMIVIYIHILISKVTASYNFLLIKTKYRVYKVSIAYSVNKESNEMHFKWIWINLIVWTGLWIL